VTALLVVDRVLVRVAVGREARRGGEKVFEGADFDGRVEYGGRDRSGRRRGGGSERGDGVGNDGRGNGLKGDVLERDMTDWAVCKLVLDPTVLGEWGKEGVELGLSKTDDGGSGFFSKLLEVKLGSGAEGFRVSGLTRVMPALADEVEYWGDWGI